MHERIFYLEGGGHGDLAHGGEGGGADDGSEENDGAEHGYKITGKIMKRP
jgi:hypothetical protein